jgi:hypothetical protein
MKTKRKVDIFSAGCPLCQEAVELQRSGRRGLGRRFHKTWGTS